MRTPIDAFNEDHLSFALGELGLRLDEFYDMPWCEYLIKCFAWQRMEKEKWRHTRLIAFESLRGPHINPKGIPKSIEKYIPLDKHSKHKSQITPEQRELFIQRLREYEEAKLKK